MIIFLLNGTSKIFTKIILRLLPHGTWSNLSAAQLLEQNLQPFRQQLYPRQVRSPQALSLEDDIRLLYVAYSRAEYGLIIVGTQQNIKNHVAAPNRDATWFRRNIPAIIV